MTDKIDNPTKGILMIVMAMFIFACQDTVTKQLAQSYDAPQILWVRFLFFGVFAVILSSWNQPLKQVVKAHRPWLQIVRSLLIVLEISAFVLALRVLSLAETHALFASFPLMVTAMSALILREKVGIRRWAAVLVGFSGVLIILRPGFGVFQLESLIALSAALMFSIYHVLTRIVSRNDSSNTSMLYMAVIGAAIMTCIGPLYWIEPTPQAWRLLALLPGLLLAGCMGMPAGVEPVSDFELKKYMGKWYEIARLNHSFERGMEQVTAEYTIRDDGMVAVENRGYIPADDKWKNVVGKATYVDDPTKGYLKVSFFGPFYSSYVIFDLDKENYDYAFVSGPDTSYLWLLARSSRPDPNVIERFVSKAKALGFDTDALIYVKHE